MKPTIMTLWNDNALSETALAMNSAKDWPVLAITRLTVTSFYGVSLGSTNYTSNEMNPQSMKADELKKWRDDNEEILNRVVAAREYFQRQITVIDELEEHIMPLSDVLASQNPSKYYPRVKGRILDVTQTFYYLGCEGCGRSISAKYNWTFDCTKCKKRCQIKPKLKITINVFDEKKEVDVILFANEAEQVACLTAEQCRERFEQKQPLPFDEINLRLANMFFLLKLKRKVFEKYDGGQIQYSSLSLTVTSNEPAGNSLFTSEGSSKSKMLVMTDSLKKKTAMASSSRPTLPEKVRKLMLFLF